MVRGLVILALLQFSVCHPKDRECFPTEVESQISSDSEISLDITHVYTIQYGSDPYASETEKSKSRITLIVISIFLQSIQIIYAGRMVMVCRCRDGKYWQTLATCGNVADVETVLRHIS